MAEHDRQGNVPAFSEFRIGSNILVLSATILTQAFGVGFPPSLGILYETLLDEFHEPKSQTAAVSTTCAGMASLTGAIASVFCLRFGTDATVALGGALTILGLLASYFATGVIYLIISCGLVTGLGCAFLTIGGASACVNQFDAGRSLAVGITAAGAGLGIFLLQQLQYYLISAYGWRGSMMLLSGVAFHLILAALVIRTFKRGRHSSEGPEAKARRHGFDFRFLKDWRFDVWLVYFMLGTFTTPLPYFALSDYAKDNEFSETVGLWMLSSYSLVSIPARFAIGVFVHNFPRQTMVFATLTTGLFGVTLVLLGYIQTEVHGLVLASLGGLCSGFLIGSQSVATLQLSGVNKFALYFGITSTAAGVTKMISGPILGWVTDATGGYPLAFIVAGSVDLCACVILGTTELIFRHFKFS